MLYARAWLLLAGCWFGATAAQAQDGTWLFNPGSNDWNTAANWAPATVPTGEANFGASNTTSVAFSSNASIGALQFNAGAPAYNFDLSSSLLKITGEGIVNHSSNRSVFSTTGQVVATDRLYFQGSSTAGNAIITNNSLGVTKFFGTSTAENAIIHNNAGLTIFSDRSTAGRATITNIAGFTRFSDASTAADASIIDGPGETSTFEGTSTAAHATITNNGGGVGFADASTAASATITNNAGGSTNFLNSSSVGVATITNNKGGSTVFLSSSSAADFTIRTNSGGVTVFLGASTAGHAAMSTNSGGITEFFGSSTAGNAILSTNSGAATFFFSAGTGGKARFITKAGGVFDISGLSTGTMTSGSIEGAGTYRLGSSALTAGLNNRSSEVSGTLDDGGVQGGTGGALIKVGTGTLTLSGSNTYSGGTSLNGGILAAHSDANLGTGPLSFDGGTLQALAAGGGILSKKAVTLNLAGGSFLSDEGTVSILRGAIKGAGGLTKIGSGTLVLTGTGAYRGDTNVNGGSLRIENGGVISDASGSVGSAPNSTGTVMVTGLGSTWTNSHALFVGGNNGGPQGRGLLQIAFGGTVISAVNTIWQTGVLAIGESFTLKGPVTINGGTLRTIANTNLPNDATLGAGGAIFDSNGFSSAFSGAFTGLGGIGKVNAGAITLIGANTYSGGTEINGGILAVRGDGNLGTGPLSLNGGTLEALPMGGGLASTKAVTLDRGGGTFLADAGTTSTLSGEIGGAGALVKRGLGILVLASATPLAAVRNWKLEH